MIIRNSRDSRVGTDLNGSTADLLRQLERLETSHAIASERESREIALADSVAFSTGGALYLVGMVLAGLIATFSFGWIVGFPVLLVAGYLFMVLIAGFYLLTRRPNWFTRLVISGFTSYKKER